MGSTSIAPQVLQTSGVFACEYATRTTGAWMPTGVVTADLQILHQGTGAPFAGLAASAARVVTPRPQKNSVSGLTTSSPPV